MTCSLFPLSMTRLTVGENRRKVYTIVSSVKFFEYEFFNIKNIPNENIKKNEIPNILVCLFFTPTLSNKLQIKG